MKKILLFTFLLFQIITIFGQGKGTGKSNWSSWKKASSCFPNLEISYKCYGYEPIVNNYEYNFKLRNIGSKSINFDLTIDFDETNEKLLAGQFFLKPGQIMVHVSQYSSTKPKFNIPFINSYISGYYENPKPDWTIKSYNCTTSGVECDRNCDEDIKKKKKSSAQKNNANKNTTNNNEDDESDVIEFTTTKFGEKVKPTITEKKPVVIQTPPSAPKNTKNNDFINFDFKEMFDYCDLSNNSLDLIEHLKQKLINSGFEYLGKGVDWEYNYHVFSKNNESIRIEVTGEGSTQRDGSFKKHFGKVTILIDKQNTKICEALLKWIDYTQLSVLDSNYWGGNLYLLKDESRIDIIDRKLETQNALRIRFSIGLYVN